MCKEFNSVNLNKDQIYLSEYKFSKDDFFDENEKPKSPQVLSPEVVG